MVRSYGGGWLICSAATGLPCAQSGLALLAPVVLAQLISVLFRRGRKVLRGRARPLGQTDFAFDTPARAARSFCGAAIQRTEVSLWVIRVNLGVLADVGFALDSVREIFSHGQIGPPPDQFRLRVEYTLKKPKAKPKAKRKPKPKKRPRPKK